MKDKGEAKIIEIDSLKTLEEVHVAYWSKNIFEDLNNKLEEHFNHSPDLKVDKKRKKNILIKVKRKEKSMHKSYMALMINYLHAILGFE